MGPAIRIVDGRIERVTWEHHLVRVSVPIEEPLSFDRPAFLSVPYEVWRSHTVVYGGWAVLCYLPEGWSLTAGHLVEIEGELVVRPILKELGSLFALAHDGPAPSAEASTSGGRPAA